MKNIYINNVIANCKLENMILTDEEIHRLERYFNDEITIDAAIDEVVAKFVE